jgi:hypothetical protein
MSGSVTQCPHCGAGLLSDKLTTDGEPYRLAILVEVQGVYDGGLFYQCPFCNGRWHRFPEDHWLYPRAARYIGEQPVGEAP